MNAELTDRPEPDDRDLGAGRDLPWTPEVERPLPAAVDRVDLVDPEARAIVGHADLRALEGRGTHLVRGVHPDALAHYVDGVINGQVPDVLTKHTTNAGGERITAHWDPDKCALVIQDGDAGTVFTPKLGKEKFDVL
ncbi:hypothetical protein GCM10022243_29890 [Saccharothrix violaceirubra]|uniref:Uncharacterized protein n=1 Tax=Saccharothrix violaceirubra TaxID=413306 RepID=A0A7W7T4U4_9PSEU|nr:hypothetical protein [Saccharothrix violaceirubra]MBB4966613.1 hypothetical protein [Saccharothrix violaceirubra]